VVDRAVKMSRVEDKDGDSDLTLNCDLL
jgi:hypothetical protein